MTKAPDALRTIGEVATETGIAPHILRYWETHVPALKPVRRAGGRRYFRPEDIAVIRRLHALVSEQGYTLEGAARALRHGGATAAATIAAGAPATDAPIAAPIAAPMLGNDAMLSDKLQRIRQRLQSALDRNFA